MKAASIHQLQKEIHELEPKQVLELCMRLAKYKKENKELLSYLIFEAHDERTYIHGIKEEIDILFSEMNKSTNYLAKRSLRKILRLTNKYIKYSGSKETEVELKIYFCSKIKDSGIRIHESIMLSNLYNREVEKIKIAIAKLHEDLQYDYNQDLEKL